MGALSTFAAAGMQNLTLRAETFASPATVYLGWFTTPPSPDGTATQVSGGGHVRQPITFLAAADGSITQDAAVTWTSFHAGADQMLAGWGIWDAASGGNLLAIGRTPSYLVRMGAGFTLPAGRITIDSDDRAMSHYLANAWLDHLFRGVTFTAPSLTYLGQYLTTPTASSAGVEVSAAGYDRQSAAWDTTGTGLSVLDDLASWAPLTTDDDQTLEGWALLDENSAGNVLWFASWPSVIDVAAGDTFEMAAGTVSLKAA